MIEKQIVKIVPKHRERCAENRYHAHVAHRRVENPRSGKREQYQADDFEEDGMTDTIESCAHEILPNFYIRAVPNACPEKGKSSFTLGDLECVHRHGKSCRLVDLVITKSHQVQYLLNKTGIPRQLIAPLFRPSHVTAAQKPLNT